MAQGGNILRRRVRQMVGILKRTADHAVDQGILVNDVNEFLNAVCTISVIFFM